MPGKACCATSPVAKETSMPRPQPSHRQSDLFWPKDPPVPIAAFDRAKLLPLVSALLAETLAIIGETEEKGEGHALPSGARRFHLHPPCCMDQRCGRTEPDPCSGSC